MSTITDATVVAQAYDTSGNGGRKIIKLNNGNLYAVSKSSTQWFLHRSTDNGNTWDTPYSSVTYTSVTDIAIATNGTSIFFLNAINGTTIQVGEKRESSIASTYNYINLETNQTAIGNVSLAINESKTELHAAWSSKNATYPNSFNIRYAKGTINGDGSVTWGAVEQVTNVSTVGYDSKNPSIIVTNGVPRIFSDYTYASKYIIYHYYKDGNLWSYNKVLDAGSYAQSSPSAIYVPQSINGLSNGRIWVAWHGQDSTNTTAYNLRVSYSDDGGATWSAMQKLTVGTVHQSSPSITYNNKNEIFIVWQGIDSTISTYYNIRKIKYSNNAFGSIQTITNGTTGALMSPSTLVDQIVNFSEPLFIYTDTVNSKVGFYGTWTTTTISVTPGDIGQKTDKNNLLTYSITTDGEMSTITEKINGTVVNTRTATSGQALKVGLTQDQWDAVRFGKYRELMDTSTNLDDANLFLNERYTGSVGGILGTISDTNYARYSSGKSVTYPGSFILNIKNGYVVDVYGVDLNSTIKCAFLDLSDKSYINIAKDTEILVFQVKKSPTSPINRTEAGAAGCKITPISVKQNTLTVSMGTDTWTYTFDKRLATDADILSAVKAVKDTNEVYLPAQINRLAEVAKGKGAVIPSNPKIDDIVDGIKNTPSGRVLSGIVTSSNTSTSYKYISTTGGTNACSVSVTGLTFKPKRIFIKPQSMPASNNVTEYHYGLMSSYPPEQVFVNAFSHVLSTSSTTIGFKADLNGLSVTNTGFVLPVANANTVYEWTAYEN